ncbi:Ubiquitin-specific protease [Phytophthora palmivora]|uniref:Ubiquitin-specific protease n=1 Tax=Phytophthora palmivora TaxID=4796 RepID=A0A2P4XMS7_9STRA|nr:Ubiquitin-specific protease [Phytophthora palmivora]
MSHWSILMSKGNVPRRPGLREQFPRQQPLTGARFLENYPAAEQLVHMKRPRRRNDLVAKRRSDNPSSRSASRSLNFEAPTQSKPNTRHKRASWNGRSARVTTTPTPSRRQCKSARKSKDCMIPGCTKGARSRGLCKRHGGGKRCTYPGCSRSDQGGGFCIAHGGGAFLLSILKWKRPTYIVSCKPGKRCATEGCKNSAQSRGLCKSHGGIQCASVTSSDIRGKRCRAEGCLKSSQGGGYCRGHGGGRAMADLTIQCMKKVVLEVTRDDGEIDRNSLETNLVLRKEVGNARLVSGDAMLWVGKGVLSHKDSTLDSTPTRTVRVENGKRRFVFILSLDDTSKHFYSELKDQVDGKAGMEIRKKKRKIRKQLSKVMGFTPVNTLKSPLKSPSLLLSPAKKPPMTPKRSPLADIGTPQRTPQLTLPPPLPVTTKGSSSLTSPLRSPFRSPFRKKARLSQSPSSGSKLGVDSTPPRSPTREWLSPARSLKLRSGPTPPDLKRHSTNTPENQSSQKEGGSAGSSGEKSRRKSITGSINKRVRSLQLMLDDDSSIKEAEAQAQKKITSHFFKMSDKTARALDVSMEAAAADETEQPVDKSDAANPSASDSPGDGAQRSTHGLLNLGNYCYMNAIVQALAALPEFVHAIQDEDNLLKIIRKQPQPCVKVKTLEQIKTIFDNWRTSGDTKHLPLQYALNQLLQLVINGSETSINPEPLKNVMGKKNSIFATHFQQDAHEFLLNLVTEYEKELVQMVHEVTEKIEEEAKSSPQVQKNNLLSFFRNGPNAKENQVEKKDKFSNAELELICRLPPAKCFRAELNRTLTCRKCGYSRKKTETFYDFSLDLPYYPVLEQEPTAEEEPQAPPSPERQCFCNHTPVQTGEGIERYYCCPKASCSYREKIVESEESTSPTKSSDTVMKNALSPSTPAPGLQPRPHPIELETLIRKQFETEVLELTCEKCKDGKEAESAYQVQSLPSVLVFHLKRFEVNPHTGALFKRCDPVVPPAVIDPTHSINNCSPSGSEARYVLRSVIHHLGKSIDEGHYVADVCTANGQWIRRNDTHESMISEDYALQAYRSQESCYMFFYVKSERGGVDEGKENVPLNRPSQDENDENSSQQRQEDRSTGLRAFL